MAWHPPPKSDVLLTVALVVACQRFFAAFGASIWGGLCAWGGPKGALTVLT
jgi:hypothetical protein